MKRGEFTGDARRTVSRRISLSRLGLASRPGPMEQKRNVSRGTTPVPRTSVGAAEALIRGPAQDCRAAGQSLRAPGFGSAFSGLLRWAPARIALSLHASGARGRSPDKRRSRRADPGAGDQSLTGPKRKRRPGGEAGTPFFANMQRRGRQRRRPQAEIRLPRLPRRRVRRPRRRARWRARPRSRRPRHGRCARPRRGPDARPLRRCGRR